MPVDVEHGLGEAGRQREIAEIVHVERRVDVDPVVDGGEGRAHLLQRVGAERREQQRRRLRRARARPRRTRGPGRHHGSTRFASTSSRACGAQRQRFGVAAEHGRRRAAALAAAERSMPALESTASDLRAPGTAPRARSAPRARRAAEIDGDARLEPHELEPLEQARARLVVDEAGRSKSRARSNARRAARFSGSASSRLSDTAGCAAALVRGEPASSGAKPRRSNKRRSAAVSGLPVVSSFSP